MKLHLNKNLFIEAVKITAQQMNIHEIYIEKDYWVTYALYTIFSNPIGEETVFKGGTALSKCFGLIERFSEDIDLVVKKNEKETGNQLKTKIKTVTDLVAGVLPEIEFNGITQKRGMNRKTAHSYKKEFSGKFGQVRDVIVVEATWLGSYKPFVTKRISSLIYEMMINGGQEKIAEENGLLPFAVQTLAPKRTLCEKIMSLVRFSYTNNAVEDLKNKVRHTYDLFYLLSNKELLKFFESAEFNKLLLKVANDDVLSFRNNNDWLKHHPGKSKMFSELNEVWTEIRSTYNGEFRNLVYGDFPNEDEIYKTLKLIRERLKTVDWTVTIENPKEIE